MPFLTIAAVEYAVEAQGASEGERSYAGERERSFNNALRSTRTNGKRSWSFFLAPMATATYNTLITNTAGDAAVNVAGDALGATVSCMVTVTDGPYVRDGSTHKRRAHVSIDEI